VNHATFLAKYKQQTQKNRARYLCRRHSGLLMIHSTIIYPKSPASEAGNADEPGLTSQVGKVGKFVCA